jgi:hypothetical protein
VVVLRLGEVVFWGGERARPWIPDSLV